MIKFTDWLNRSKITLTIYMLVSVAILVLGFYYYKQQKHELQDKIEDELKSITELKANQLTQWYTERLSEVIFFSNENLLIESTHGFILGDVTKKISLKKNLSHMLSNKRYENIFIVSRSGSLIFSLDSTFSTLDSIDVNLSKQTIEKNDIIFSDIYLDKVLYTPQLDFAAPIKDKKGTIIASLIFRINPKDFLYPFIQSWPTQSKTAETVIVRRDGDSIILINDARHRKESALRIKFPLTKNDIPGVRAVLGSYGIFEGYDYRHVKVLTYSMPIPKTPWIMISKVDTDEIDRPIRIQARNFGLILFLFIVLLVSLLISIRSTDKNRHYKKLIALETERKILLSHFEYLIKYANDIIILANEYGQIVEVNESALIAYQLTADEIKKKKLSSLGKFNINFENHNKIQFEVSNKPYESVHKRKNGEEFPVEISEKVIEIDSVRYYQAIIRDISERKKSEIELNENEVQYRNLANSGMALIWKSETDKLCTYFNEPWLKFTGRTLEQELGNGWTEGLHPEDFNDCLQTYVTSFDNRKPFEMEYRLRHASGEYRWIKDLGTPNYNSKGEFIGYIGHCFDITNQKIIEDALIKSETTHRLLFDNNPIPMWVYEVDTLKFLKVNDAAISKYGFSNDEFLSMTLKDIRPPEEVQLLLANIKTNNTKIQRSGTWKHRLKSGKIILVDIHSHEIIFDDKKARIVATYDITERIKVEEEIQHLNERISTATEAAQIGIWDWDIVNNVLVWDDRMYSLYGLSKEEFKGAYNAWLKGVHPDDRSKSDEESKLALSGEKEYDTEFRVVWPDNSIHYIKAKGNVFKDEAGKPIRMLGVNFDITERKLAEIELQANKAKLDAAISSMTDAIFISDNQGNFINFNEAFATFHKFKNKEACAKTFAEYPTFLDVYLPTGELATINQWAVPRALRGEIISNAEYKLHRKDTGETWVGSYSFAPIRDKDRNIIGSVVTARDITEIKQAENNLRQLHDNFAKIFHSNPTAMVITSFADGKFLNINEAYTKIVGYNASEISGRSVNELNLYLNPEERKDILKSLKENGTLRGREIHIRNKSGNTVVVLIYMERIKYNGEDSILTTLIDITEQKKAENTIKESEEKLSNLISSMQVGVLLQNSLSKILMSNTKALELLGLSKDQLLGKTSFDPDWNVIHEDGSPFPGSTHPVPQAIATGQPVLNVVMGVYRPTTGNRVWLLVDAVPQLNSNGKVEQVVCTFIDISQRKQAEKDLHESEKLYQNLFENMLNGFAYCRMYYEDNIPTDFRYLSVNKAFEKLTGLKDVSGKLVSEVIPGIREADPKLFEFYDRVALTGTPESFELYVEALNDWYSVTAYSPEKEYFVAIFDVITERKLSEKALRKSEERYRTTLDNMIEGCQIIGFDWKYIYINKAAEKQNRRSNDELIGKKYADMWPGVESTQVFAAMKRVLEEKVDLHFENEFTFPDGYIGWYDLSIQHVPEGIFILSVDITERKQAEDKLNQLNSELELRIIERTKELSDLYNNAPCGYHSLDKDGLFIHINDTELKLLGYKQEEVVGKINVFEILTQKSQEKFKATYPLFKKQGFLMDIELEFIKKDGSILPILLSATAVYDTNGDYLMSRSTLIDNTYLKRAKDEILESKAILELANKELEAFSYSVSHDLRAPLRAIHGFIQILEEDYNDKLDAEGVRLITIVKDNTKRMGQLIDNLLAFSRINRTEIRKTNFDPTSIIDSILSEQVSPENREKIKLTVGKLPNITGDANLLRQVWANLISNAIKYTSKINYPEIEIGCTEKNDEYEFYIKDNGAGFDMLYVDKLFGVFQRLHNNNEFEGTGVGLAIIQRIIVRHGGKVWAKGEVDKGAIFFFTIPKIV